jgi:hypothetical protein
VECPKDYNEPWLVIGAGNQGSKHISILAEKCLGIIDTHDLKEGLSALKSFTKKGVRNVIIATPDAVKTNYILEAMSLNLNIAVEKPLPLDGDLYFHIYRYISQGNRFQTLYDHLTDSLISTAIERIKLIVEESIEWSSLVLEYGFGTRNIIKRSSWMDFGSGPWELVSPHLLKIAVEIGVLDNEAMDFCFGFGGLTSPSQVMASRGGNHFLSVKTSYTSWKNTFRLNFHYENGSIEINGLEKWGLGLLRVYCMDFDRNVPIIIEEKKSQLNVSYVQQIHKNLFCLDMLTALNHDRLIWQHIKSGRSSLIDFQNQE